MAHESDLGDHTSARRERRLGTTPPPVTFAGLRPTGSDPSSATRSDMAMVARLEEQMGSAGLAATLAQLTGRSAANMFAAAAPIAARAAADDWAELCEEYGETRWATSPPTNWDDAICRIADVMSRARALGPPSMGPHGGGLQPPPRGRAGGGA